ncbi:glycosyltransferase family 4 protein [Lewinella cohaerens]|uniref:glycosyltransferase family 4 protein n=1 Tax=Lewinella cohaerens TaxID=70995 RepID=UPI00146E4280|nr:glycosyltransferase family 4 protein [Lewinella cohaerens]
MSSIICTVTNDLSQDQRMIRICSTLQAAGHRVTLVGRRLPHSRPLVNHPFQQHRLRCWFHTGKLFYLEYNLRLLYYLYQQRAEIINAVDLDTLLPSYLISRLQRGVCVYDAHEYFTEVPEVVRRPKVQRLWSALADWIIPSLQHAYTVAPALAELMTERYGTSFKVVRNVPYRQSALHNQIIPDKKIIFYQGMLNEGRGLEAAILAMKQLPPTLVLHIAGSGDLEQKLHQLVVDHQLEDRVHFLGFVLPAELPALTEKAWLGLNLLENTGLSYYYSLANKTFDYIQSGVPALHMDFPEYRALHDQYDTFELLADLEVNTIASAIQGLVDTPDRYAQLQQNNLEAAKYLTWEEEEKKLLAIYEKL